MVWRREQNWKKKRLSHLDRSVHEIQGCVHGNAQQWKPLLNIRIASRYREIRIIKFSSRPWVPLPLKEKNDENWLIKPTVRTLENKTDLNFNWKLSPDRKIEDREMWEEIETILCQEEAIVARNRGEKKVKKRCRRDVRRCWDDMIKWWR